MAQIEKAERMREIRLSPLASKKETMERQAWATVSITSHPQLVEGHEPGRHGQSRRATFDPPVPHLCFGPGACGRMRAPDTSTLRAPAPGCMTLAAFRLTHSLQTGRICCLWPARLPAGFVAHLRHAGHVHAASALAQARQRYVLAASCLLDSSTSAAMVTWVGSRRWHWR